MTHQDALVFGYFGHVEGVWIEASSVSSGDG